MTDQNQQAADQPAGGQPTVQCLSQYVKDLSFENPNAARAATTQAQAPNVTVNVQIGINKLRDTLFEVTLSVEGKAMQAEQHLFLMEMHYAGLFTLENIPAEHVDPILYIHCPTLLFPFARQIVAEVTRNGGYPPLLLDPVDFNSLYHEQIAKSRAQGTA